MTAPGKLAILITRALFVPLTLPLIDVFMPRMIAADRGGGQATQGPSVGRLFGFLKSGILPKQLRMPG
jgi:hypothetical protein